MTLVLTFHYVVDDLACNKSDIEAGENTKKGDNLSIQDKEV